LLSQIIDPENCSAFVTAGNHQRTINSLHRFFYYLNDERFPLALDTFGVQLFTFYESVNERAFSDGAKDDHFTARGSFVQRERGNNIGYRMNIRLKIFSSPDHARVVGRMHVNGSDFTGQC
jgi:hypothetical protein